MSTRHMSRMAAGVIAPKTVARVHVLAAERTKLFAWGELTQAIWTFVPREDREAKERAFQRASEKAGEVSDRREAQWQARVEALEDQLRGWP